MRVLVATDDSRDARAAITYLKAFPLPPSATFRIASVVPLPSFVLDVPPVREFKRSAVEAARHVVEAARASLALRGFPIETDVAVGDPKEEIIRRRRRRFAVSSSRSSTSWSVSGAASSRRCSTRRPRNSTTRSHA